MKPDQRSPIESDLAMNKVKYEISRLSGHGDVVDFLRILKNAKGKGMGSVEVDTSSVSKVYPNGAVPISAIVEHYRSTGLDVKFINVAPGSYFDHARVRNPLIATSQTLREPASRLSVVWAYNEDSVVDLTNCIIEELAERIEFSAGVLSALNWCLFEVLDNVFQHSGKDVGFFMAQILRNSKRLLFCVADSGMGIHKSFYSHGKYRPPTAFDSLTLAVRQGVSSTGDKRGNGLFGLKGVIDANGGKLRIQSGRGMITFSPAGVEGSNLHGDQSLILDSEHHSTAVDFSLDVSSPVDLGDVLGTPVTDLRLEQIENDYDEHVIPIIEHAHGTGTRTAAERLRNYLMNYLNEGAPYLVLDFANVTMVSSSFADETIGKLAERFGMVGFSQKFRLVNMNSNVQMLLDRAIGLRVSAQYYRDDEIPKLRRK